MSDIRERLATAIREWEFHGTHWQEHYERLVDEVILREFPQLGGEAVAEERYLVEDSIIAATKKRGQTVTDTSKDEVCICPADPSQPYSRDCPRHGQTADLQRECEELKQQCEVLKLELKASEDGSGINARLRKHFCICEQPISGAQPVGTFVCERCGKCRAAPC